MSLIITQFLNEENLVKGKFCGFVATFWYFDILTEPDRAWLSLTELDLGRDRLTDPDWASLLWHGLGSAGSEHLLLVNIIVNTAVSSEHPVH